MDLTSELLARDEREYTLLSRVQWTQKELKRFQRLHRQAEKELRDYRRAKVSDPNKRLENELAAKDLDGQLTIEHNQVQERATQH